MVIVMSPENRPDFSFIVSDNEGGVAAAIDRGEFVQAYLLVHSLVECLLRIFLGVDGKQEVSFSQVIARYAQFLEENRYPQPTFAKELTEFNKRRNRIVHELWRKGFTATNRQAEPAAHAAIIMYGLFVEWLETWDPEITTVGFHYE